jgi:hypothetical protein
MRIDYIYKLFSQCYGTLSVQIACCHIFKHSSIITCFRLLPRFALANNLLKLILQKFVM